MNMNKKIMLIIITFFSFCVFSLDVFADEKPCNTHALNKSECESHSYQGYKCEWDGSKKGGSRCSKSDKLSEENKESLEKNATKCSDITDSKTCNGSTIKGYQCIYRQGVCTESLTNNGTDENAISDTPHYNQNQTTTSDNTNSQWKEKECSDITDSKTCSDRQDCVYTGGSCQDAFVASNPCNENSVKRTLKFFGFLLLIAKYMVPLIIIGFASFDLYKAVVDKDEKSLNKQLRMIIIRIVSGIIVFLLPDIVYAIMGLSDKTDIKDNQDYSMCAKCLLKTSECEISSESDNGRTCSSHLTQSECENRDYIWDGQCCRIPTCSTLMLPDECRRRGYNYDTDNKCCKMPSVDGSTSSSTHISSSGRVHGGIGGSY